MLIIQPIDHALNKYGESWRLPSSVVELFSVILKVCLVVYFVPEG